jgi:glycosyltransferase involved in cell wall biosynthesis
LVLVVVPTYQEADNIETLLRRVRAAVPVAAVLVVDDGSPDGTADIAKALGHDIGRLDVLVRPAKGGLGSAYREGFSCGLALGYAAIVEIDSDLSHDPDMIPSLVASLSQADLAIGSRYVPGGSIPDWPLHRRLVSRCGNRYARWMLRLPVHDSTSGFRAYRAEMLRAIEPASVRTDGYGFQIEMAYRVCRRGGRIVELPIAFVERQRGASKMSAGIVVEAFVAVTCWGIRDRAEDLVRAIRPRARKRHGHARGRQRVAPRTSR